MAINWTLQKRKIADLKPHPRNPRKLSKHDYAQLKKSLERFGVIDKPIVNGDGTIIGGHQRLEVLRKQKAKEIDCWVPERNLDENEIDELNVRLNRNLGEWDWDILANEWDVGDLLEWGFSSTEFNIDNADEASQKEECEKCPTCGKKQKAKR